MPVLKRFVKMLSKERSFSKSEYLALRAELRAFREKCGAKGHDFEVNKALGVEYCSKCGKGRNKNA